MSPQPEPSMVSDFVAPQSSVQAGQIATLAEIKARLQARRVVDVSKLPTHDHDALGRVHIGPMSSAGYAAIENVPQHTVPPQATPEQGAIIKAMNGRAADKPYLLHGVWLPSGEQLDEETVAALLDDPQGGAANRALVTAIKKLNPPREVLVAELRISRSFDGMACVLFRILERAGALQKLRDWMLADPQSEEAASLAEDLRKWEATLPAWEALLEAEDAAQHFKLGVYERMRRDVQNEV